MEVQESKTILIDLDDVVWDLCSLWVRALNNQYGYSVKVEDIKQWDITLAFPGLSEKQVYDMLNPALVGNLIPRPEAIKYIKKLYKEGYSIYFVTSTYAHNLKTKCDLIDKYFDFLGHERVISCHHKYMIKGDFMIDDYIENLKERKHPILYDTFYNQEVELENAHRCENWKEIYEYIHKVNS